MAMNTITVAEILDQYGRDEGKPLFGRTYLHMLKTTVADFPVPLRGGTKGSRIHYRAEEIAEYFADLRKRGFPQASLLANYYNRHIKAQAAEILQLINESELDLEFEVRTKTCQVIWKFDDQLAADEFEKKAWPIEERLSEFGWSFKFEIDEGEEMRQAG